MKHARKDYDDRIQDSANLIPEGEPVFLIRGQDALAGDVVRCWSALHEKKYGPSEVSLAVRAHAEKMDSWPVKKQPDTPLDLLKKEG